MGKIVTLEVVIRGDIIQKNIVLKLGRFLSESKLRADFSSSIVVPPFGKAVAKRYPSLGIFHVTVDLEDRFAFENILKKLCEECECRLVSLEELRE